MITPRNKLRTHLGGKKTNDRDLPREIYAEDIDPSQRMGPRMTRMLLNAKLRALKQPNEKQP